MALFPDLTCDDIFRLETKRLWLRWLRASDAPALGAIASQADVANKTASIPHPYPQGEAARFILEARAETVAGRALILAVTTKTKSQTFIGIVSAQAGDPHEVEIGYVIAPTAAGQGLGSEATAALVDAIFNLTEARAVTANSRTINPASRRVLENCGFAFKRSGLHHLLARGGQYPCDFFVLDRRDWSARQRGGRLPAMTHQRKPQVQDAIGEQAQQ